MNEINKQKLFELDKNEKNCFIISPIGNEGSVIRRKVEGMIDAVITPVLKEFGKYSKSKRQMKKPYYI